MRIKNRELCEEAMVAIMELIRKEHLTAENLLYLSEDDFVRAMVAECGWLSGNISYRDVFLRVYYYNKLEEEK